MSRPGWAVPPAGVSDPAEIVPERETAWSVDGVPLSTFCYDVTTKGGSRAKPPPLRGSDTILPHAPGQKRGPRVIDARTVELQMWLTGATRDGLLVDEQAYERNWRALVGLCWNQGRPVQLTKRFYELGQLREATATAVYADGLEPTMTGPVRSEFTVAFTLADPFFYAPARSILLPLPSTRQIQVDGDADTTLITLRHDSRFTNFEIRNLTTGSRFVHRTTIPDGAGARYEIADYRAVISPAAGPEQQDTVRIDQTGSSSPWWLDLAIGDNTLQLLAAAGAGNVQLDYQARYL
jgi:hypothetical protein